MVLGFLPSSSYSVLRCSRSTSISLRPHTNSSASRHVSNGSAAAGMTVASPAKITSDCCLVSAPAPEQPHDTTTPQLTIAQCSCCLRALQQPSSQDTAAVGWNIARRHTAGAATREEFLDNTVGGHAAPCQRRELSRHLALATAGMPALPRLRGASQQAHSRLVDSLQIARVQRLANHGLPHHGCQ